MAVLEDRERIARDLHDKVIQRLFAAGMSLQTALPLTGRSEVASRKTIFALEASSRRGVRVDIFTTVDAAREALGFSPELRLDGPIDSVVSDEVAEDLLATLQEALSNVAQHAGCSRVGVVVEAGADLLLRIVDDGVGLPKRIEYGNGLHNMEHRARARTRWQVHSPSRPEERHRRRMASAGDLSPPQRSRASAELAGGNDVS